MTAESSVASPAPAASAPEPPEAPRKSRARSTVELLVIVALALAVALLVQAVAFKPYRIPSGSMLPALEPGQRILVDRLSHTAGSDPGLGDITVFTPPAGAVDGRCGVAGQGPFYAGPASGVSCSRATPNQADTTFVKRVVGLPGDRIAVRGGHVVRNGRLADEPFASGCAGPACDLAPIVVPAGMYFLMGDNRGNSDDSRYWGPIPRDWVIGRAVASYWPPSKVGGL